MPCSQVQLARVVVCLIVLVDVVCVMIVVIIAHVDVVHQRRRGTERERDGERERSTLRADDPPRMIQITSQPQQHNSQTLQRSAHRSSQNFTPGGATATSFFLMTSARFFLRGVGLEENTFSRLHHGSLSLISPGRTHSFR